jgi:hypothetical protein
MAFRALRGGHGRPGGSLIPHARPIGALVVAMVEAPFRTLLMPPARRADRGPPRGRTTPGRAIRVAAIAGGADRKEAVTAAAELLAKRRLHGVGAAAPPDWTCPENRGTTEPTGSVRRSIEAVIEGLEVSAPGPHLVCRRVSLRHPAAPHQQGRLSSGGGDVRA